MYISRIFRQVTKADRRQALIEIRKATGYSLGQCKKALDAVEYEVPEAYKWLDEQAAKEGWSKMNALSGRKASEGFCTLASSDRHLVMFELNCETDFVAKTPAFQKLVVELSEQILSEGEVIEELAKDTIAKAVYSIRENIVLPRYVVMERDGADFGTYVHSATQFNPHVSGGRYAVITKGSNGDDPTMLDEISKHIMALSPETLGPMSSKKLMRFKSADEIGDDDRRANMLPIAKNEQRLLYQEHLTRTTFPVGHFLINANASISEYFRYQLGDH